MTPGPTTDRGIMEYFILKPLLGGVAVALICGPLSCLVIWQRMVYFGATLAHSALLGVAAGLLFKLNLTAAILAVSALVSLLLWLLSRSRRMAADTILGVLAHASIALGIVILSLMPHVRVDLLAYLFGDILSISTADLLWIAGGGAVVAGCIVPIWRPLLGLIIQRDIAFTDGIDEQKYRLIFLLLLSITVAVSMQILGALLIVSFLIIPAAAARYLASSPEQMAWLASLIGILSVCGGLTLSLHYDTPAGPSIVLCNSLLFVVCCVWRGQRPA